MPEENNYARTAIERLGADPDNLGCVMLGVELPPVYKAVLDPRQAYISPKLKYAKGYDLEHHVTLLYGLLLSAQELFGRREVDGVLDGWRQPNVLASGGFDVFRSNDGVADYGCIIVRPAKEPSLAEANGRLRQLPHVDGFAKYDPHITIGYVVPEYIDQALDELRRLGPFLMRTTTLDYGD